MMPALVCSGCRLLGQRAGADCPRRVQDLHRVGDPGRDAAQLLARRGRPGQPSRELGGTQVLFHALAAGELDVYPEYTGTIPGDPRRARTSAARTPCVRPWHAASHSGPLGFNNTYALGMRGGRRRLGIRSSPTCAATQSCFGFTNEFLDRGDGWPGLRER